MKQNQQKIKVVTTTAFLLFTILLSNAFGQNHFINQKLDYDNNFESKILSQLKMAPNFKDYFENNENPTLSGLLKATKIEGKTTFIDSIVSSLYDTSYQWIKYSYKYDSNGYLIEFLGEYTDEGVKGYFSNLHFKVLRDGKLAAYLQLIWENNSWVNNSTYTNKYNADGNKISTLYEKWDRVNSTWVNNRRYIYTYDGNNNTTLNTTETWNGTSWDYTQKSQYRYDLENNLTQKIVSNWDGSAWKYYMKQNYEYDSNNNQILRISYTYSGSWVVRNKTVFNYDANNNNISTNYYLWNSSTNQWDNSDWYLYTYDANGNLIFSISKQWDFVTADWVNINRITNTYNSNGKKLTYLNETWDGSDWVNANASDYSYDSDDNLLTSIRFSSWNGSNWDFGIKQTFTYNSEGKCNGGKNETWFSNHWVSNDGYFYYIPGYTNQSCSDYFGYYTFGYEFTIYYQPTTDVNEDSNIAVNTFSLSQNYPNPFNPSTKIKYSLAKASHVNIIIYNTIGQKVQELVNRYEAAGHHEAIFNAEGLSSGLYFYRIETPGFTKTMKMMLLR